MENTIILLDENNREVEFDLIAKFGLDDIDYVALMEVDGEDFIEILRLDRDEDGNTLFSGIENPKELDDAIEAYEELTKDKN